MAALWRLHADVDPVEREHVERRTVRVIGLSLIALAIYIVVESGRALYFREIPEKTIPGIAIAMTSVVTMPLLARAKRTVGIALGSCALTADAMQTRLCMWLSAIVLVGVGLNAMLGWWWADPLAALCMVPIIAKERIDGLRDDGAQADCC